MFLRQLKHNGLRSLADLMFQDVLIEYYDWCIWPCCVSNIVDRKIYSAQKFWATGILEGARRILELPGLARFWIAPDSLAGYFMFNNVNIAQVAHPEVFSVFSIILSGPDSV